MTKPKVIIDTGFRKMDEIFSKKDHSRLQDTIKVIWGKDAPIPLELFHEALPEAEVIICADWHYGDVIRKAAKLKAVILVSGGFPRSLDYDYCFENSIRVLSVSPAFARQVAEMSLGLALAASREIAAGDRAFREGTERYLHAGNLNTFMLYAKTMGIIGYGSIARALHPLLKPFNPKILAYDPWLGDNYLRGHGVEPVSLQNLLNESKVIFVLAAPTAENKAMLSRKHLEMIQKNAVLVITSRAHVVDFDAMTSMVLDGRFTVATDVFPTEPLLADHPIRKAQNAVLSAHRAGSVKEGLWEIGEMVCDDLEAIVRGLPPQRLQNAAPELIRRYVSNSIKKTVGDET